MKKQPPTIGVRACIAKATSVTVSLWNCEGTVTAINVGTDFDGQALHELTLDEPPPHHSNNCVWRLRADQMHY